MAKIPKNPEEVFEEFSEDMKGVFGGDLVSIILYGSGASGHYVPGKSDLNFLIVLTQEGIDNLDRAANAAARWRTRKVSTPIFMTQAEILSSLDCYPIEFLSMKRHYTVVSGPDILSTLTFKPSYLRLQAERELKAKILHLRRGFLDAEGNARRIRELIKPSFTAFISIFRALLYLKGADIPHSQRDIVHAMAREYSIAPAVFLACADVKEGVDRISASEIRNILVDYMKEIEKLSAAVDSMNV